MSDTTTGVVELERRAACLFVFLNRPHRLNAINECLVAELLGALTVAQEPWVRAVILSGRGRSFCSGHDLKEDHAAETLTATRVRLEHLQDVTRRLQGLRAPVIAAVHGHAVGAGVEIALACDLVLAAEGTRLRFPEVGLGLSLTNGATHLLPSLVGMHRAKQLVFTGEEIDVERAEAWGLVNRILPQDRLLEAAAGLGEELSALPPTALSVAKKALTQGPSSDLATALELEIAHGLVTSRAGEQATGFAGSG